MFSSSNPSEYFHYYIDLFQEMDASGDAGPVSSFEGSSPSGSGGRQGNEKTLSPSFFASPMAAPAAKKRSRLPRRNSVSNPQSSTPATPSASSSSVGVGRRSLRSSVITTSVPQQDVISGIPSKESASPSITASTLSPSRQSRPVSTIRSHVTDPLSESSTRSPSERSTGSLGLHFRRYSVGMDSAADEALNQKVRHNFNTNNDSESTRYFTPRGLQSSAARPSMRSVVRGRPRLGGHRSAGRLLYRRGSKRSQPLSPCRRKPFFPNGPRPPGPPSPSGEFFSYVF